MFKLSKYTVYYLGIAQRARSFLIGIKTLTGAHKGELLTSSLLWHAIMSSSCQMMSSGYQ